MYNYISEEVEFGSSLRVRELSPFLKRCDTEVYSNKAHYVLMQHWIIKQLCTVPVVKGSCAIVAESHMTLLWSSNGAKHWVGVDHRAAVHVCVCACVRAFLGGLSITQSKEADRFDMSESVSGWGHYARSRTAGPSHQHKHTCSRAWAHKQAHTRTGFYGNSKQTVGACGDPTPTERKREKPRLRSKNRSKSKIESEMKHPVTYASLSRSQVSFIGASAPNIYIKALKLYLPYSHNAKSTLRT